MLPATPVEGQQIPKVLLGFNNWKIKLDPVAMKHSSIQVRFNPLPASNTTESRGQNCLNMHDYSSAIGRKISGALFSAQHQL